MDVIRETIIIPKLLYGSEIWGKFGDINSMEVVYNKYLRRHGGYKSTTHALWLNTLSSAMDITTHILHKNAKLFSKLLRLPVSCMTRDAFLFWDIIKYDDDEKYNNDEYGPLYTIYDNNPFLFAYDAAKELDTSDYRAFLSITSIDEIPSQLDYYYTPPPLPKNVVYIDSDYMDKKTHVYNIMYGEIDEDDDKDEIMDNFDEEYVKIINDDGPHGWIYLHRWITF